jgi:hypothetical protein
MTTRADLEKLLARHDPEALRLVLHASGVGLSAVPWRTVDEPTAATFAARIAEAIWWSYATPLGYVAGHASFEDIVGHLARKLGVADRLVGDADGLDPTAPVWVQVRRMTELLVGDLAEGGVRFDAIDEATRKRLGPGYGASVGLGSGAAGSFATRWTAARVLALFRTPIGRVLPYLPVVGPWVGAIRTGVGAVFAVSGPLGIALAVLSANSALGPSYRKLVPLVLGVGGLPSLEPSADSDPRPTAGTPWSDATRS